MTETNFEAKYVPVPRDTFRGLMDPISACYAAQELYRGEPISANAFEAVAQQGTAFGNPAPIVRFQPAKNVADTLAAIDKGFTDAGSVIDVTGKDYVMPTESLKTLRGLADKLARDLKEFHKEAFTGQPNPSATDFGARFGHTPAYEDAIRALVTRNTHAANPRSGKEADSLAADVSHETRNLSSPQTVGRIEGVVRGFDQILREAKQPGVGTVLSAERAVAAVDRSLNR